MAEATVVLAAGVYQFTLTTTDNEAIIDPTTPVSGPAFLQQLREFAIKADADFGGGVLKIYRWLSDNTGWVPYINTETGDEIEINYPGAGFGVGFFHQSGKIKFVLEGSTGATVPIDLMR